MREIAPGLHLLPGFPPNAVNVYLAGDVLVDAGYGIDRRRILKALKGHTVRDHVATHAHPDHVGASAGVAKALGLPGVAVGAADREAAESGRPVVPAHAPGIGARLMRWKGVPVSRTLAEGDTVGEFTVLETPGHSPGHVSFWRERDRVLVLGDVLFGLHLLTLRPGLTEPPKLFTVDPARNRRSAERIAALEPRVVAFGHGPPQRDPGRIREFVAGLL